MALLLGVFVIHGKYVFVLLAIINTKLIIHVHSKLVLVNAIVHPIFVLVQVGICSKLVLVDGIEPELVLVHVVLPELVVVHVVLPELVLLPVFVIVQVNSTNLIKVWFSFSNFTTLIKNFPT